IIQASHQCLYGSVHIQYTGRGSISDSHGAFTIENREGNTLIDTMVGYDEYTEVLGGNRQLSIQLGKGDYTDLEEVVVIGYGSVRKKDLTGSVSHIGQEVMETRVATSVTDYLKGSIAGVNIGINNNESGGGDIQVRGPATLQASSSPL